jgi:hypothetical protein
MRSKVFWEKKREDAQDRLLVLKSQRMVAAGELEFQQRRWKVRHKLSPMRREQTRAKIDHYASKLAWTERQIVKHTTRRIYCEKMLAEEPKTLWHRIRTGDGLRV